MTKGDKIQLNNDWFAQANPVPIKSDRAYVDLRPDEGPERLRLFGPLAGFEKHGVRAGTRVSAIVVITDVDADHGDHMLRPLCELASSPDFENVHPGDMHW